MFPETQVRILPGCSGLPLFSIDSPRESAGSPSWAPEGPRTVQPEPRSATGVDFFSGADARSRFCVRRLLVALLVFAHPQRDHSEANEMPARLCAVRTRGPVKLFNLGSCGPRVSCHDARYNDLAKWNSSGLCRDATIPRDTLVGSWRRSLHLREYPSRAPANPHRIGRAGCLENHRPKDGICTTGVLPQFTLRQHIRSWRADSCA
jgi:hypothetical protein